MELDRKDTELLNNHIDHLKNELEIAIKGQEDFKRIIKDLEAINKEILEENASLDESNDHLIYKNEDLNIKILYLKDEVRKLKDELSELKHAKLCHKCGKPMCWQNDYDYEPFDEDDYPGIVSFYECPDCNISYEITEKFVDNENLNMV